MNFDEALGILGIDRSAGKKGARRAYIKLIKVHKPDRDPEMFRRVREAYERVKDDIEIYARFYSPAPEPIRPEPEYDEPAQPDPAAVIEPVVRAPEPPAEEPDRLRILERDAAFDALLELPVDPPRVNPIVDAPRIDPIVDAPRIDPIVDAPRVDLLENPVRVSTHPERPIRIEPRSTPPSDPPPEPQSRPWVDRRARVFERGPSPAALLDRAWAVFNDGGAAPKVERLAQKAFAAAHADPEADQPPPVDAINLCLALFTSGRIVPARRVTRAMRDWLSETGLERSVMGGKLAASLAVLQALISLPADSPAYPVARIARATRDDALESAQPPLRTFARETPFSALTSADHFRAHAPLLDGLYGELLRAGTAVELRGMTAEVPARRGRGCLWIGGLMAALFMLGLVRGSCGSSYSQYSPPKIRAPQINLPPIEMPKIKLPPIEVPKLPKLDIPAVDAPPIQTPAGQVAGDDARRVRDFTSTSPPSETPFWLEILCRRGSGYRASVCADATGVNTHRLSGNCARARDAIRSLENAGVDSTERRGAIIFARRAYERACPKR